MRIKDRAKIPSTKSWNPSRKMKNNVEEIVIRIISINPPHGRPSWIRGRNDVGSSNRIFFAIVRFARKEFCSMRSIVFFSFFFFFNIHSRIFLSSIEINLRQREEIAFATKKRIWRKKEGDFFLQYWKELPRNF